MTIIVPVAIPAAGLPLPDPADKTTFSARKLEQLRWANNEYSTYSYNLGLASYSNALDAQASATAAASSAAGVSTNATLAAQYAGATVFVPGSTYAQWFVAFSTTNQRSYRKFTASAVHSTDPYNDPTNWKIIPIDRPSVTVSTASVTAQAGFDYLLTFAGDVTVTAMASPAVGDTFGILIANGRDTNVMNPNGNTVNTVFGGNGRIDDPYGTFVCCYLNSTYRISKA